MSKNKKGKVWYNQYNFFNAEKVYGKLRYTYDIIEKNGEVIPVKDELNTDIPDTVINGNGDNQKKWIKTIRECLINKGRSSRGLNNVKWDSWTEDDTRNKNKYNVEYVKIVIDDEDSGMGLDRWNMKKYKCFEKGRTLEQVFSIMKFSNVVGYGKSYTNGTTYKSGDTTLKKIYINEDIIVSNQNDMTEQSSWEEMREKGYTMTQFNCWEKKLEKVS